MDFQEASRSNKWISPFGLTTLARPTHLPSLNFFNDIYLKTAALSMKLTFSIFLAVRLHRLKEIMRELHQSSRSFITSHVLKPFMLWSPSTNWRLPMIILVISLILFPLLLFLYVVRRVGKQEQHLDKLKRAMNERREKEAEQSRIAKERVLSS